jgi:p-aminobenzoyl-glutamate transporter AbgT
MLGLLTKLYLRALSMSAIPDPKIIFIILIIILNLHDSSLSEFGCNIKPGVLDMNLVARSCYKSVIIKKKKFNITE